MSVTRHKALPDDCGSAGPGTGRLLPFCPGGKGEMHRSKISSSHLILVSNVNQVSRHHRLVIKSLAICKPFDPCSLLGEVSL